MSVSFLSLTQVLISLLFGLWFSFFPQAANNSVEITDPVDGQVLQGNYTIKGNTDVIGFESYDLMFAHENGSNDGDRFLISHNTAKVQDGVLGTWDTSKITDGNYRLFLVVNFVDDKPETFAVRNVRIRNYSPIEQDEEALPVDAMPTDDVFLATPIPEGEDTAAPSLFRSMFKGMIYTIMIIVVLGLILLGVTQSRSRRRK